MTHQNRPSNEEALRIIRHYEEEIGHVLDACATNHKMGRAAVLTAFTVVLGSCDTKKGRDCARNFLEAVKEGELLEKGEPAYVLRDYYASIVHPRRMKGSKNIRRAAVDSEWIIFIKTLRAARAALEGETLSVLQAPRGGSRELVEWFTGPTADLSRKLRLGTRQMRKALAEEAAQE